MWVHGSLRLLSALCFVLTSCSYRAAQTIVEIRADRLIETQATEIRIEVRDQSDALVFSRSVAPQAVEFSGFPIQLPVTAKRGEAQRRFEARVSAVQTRRAQDGTLSIATLAQNRVRTSFREGRTLRFTLWLLSGCRCNVESERCEPDADHDLVPECVPIERLVATEDVDATVVSEVSSDAAVEVSPQDVAASDVGITCAAEQHLCDGRCVSRASPLFCGDLCQACIGISGGTASCGNNACNVVCSASTPDRCPTSCVDLASDRDHCGTCGNVCAQGQLCQNRICVEPPQCAPSSDSCPGMSYCNPATNRCVSGCNGRSDQCSSERMCDVSAHSCVCRSDLRSCGTSCAQCPTAANITSTGCAGNACVVTGCASGYAPTISSCVDVNECGTNNGGCSATATCTNTQGSRTCTCNSGYGGSGLTCIDVDECAINNGGCSANATCTNTQGSRTCACNMGYSGNGIACTSICTPSCAARVCGTDGCGGSCGTCGAGACENGQCVIRPPFSGAGTILSRSQFGWVGLGHSVALAADGSALLVGQRYGDDNLGGAAFFASAGGVWNTGTSATRPPGAMNFGQSVAISSDANVAVVGDYNGAGGTGTVSTYFRAANGVWNYGAILAPGGIDFGYAVSLSSDGALLAVGDRNAGGDSRGAVLAYRRTGTNWTAMPSLPRPSGAGAFGGAVALSAAGDILAVGDENGGVNGLGAVTIYSRTGDQWQVDASVQRPAVAVRFGTSVALSANGNTMAVGDIRGGSGSGAVTTFLRSGGVWSTGTPLEVTPNASGVFGCSVSLSFDGSVLVVGDYNGGISDSRGAATVYIRDSDQWMPSISLQRPTGAGEFGWSVSVSASGTTIVASDPQIKTMVVYTR